MKLNEVLYQSILKHQANNAFCINEKYYSYSEFWEQIQGFYFQIKNLETPIGIYCKNDIQTYAAVLACLLAETPYIPIHPSYPIHRINDILGQANIQHILLPYDEIPADLKELKINFIFFQKNEKVAKIILSKKENPLGYILFTSGSTGKPKGVPINVKNLSTFIESYNASGFEITQNDKVLQMFELTFDLSVMSFLMPILSGACVYTLPEDGIKYMETYKILEENEITIALLVPSIINSLQPYFDDIDLPKLRLNLFCGEALYENVITNWKKCVPNAVIYNVYGPTEDTIFCTSYLVENNPKSYNGICCIGKAMPFNSNVIFNLESIQNGNYKLAEIDEKGELCLSGNQLTDGYLNDELKNKIAFFEFKNTRYYRTGDLCFMDKNQDVFYAGRLDHQVKVKGGFRVELSEIENVAIEFCKNQVAAVTKMNQNNMHLIHLFIQKNGQSSAEVLAHLKTHLPDYMLPEKIHELENFPLNNSGKIDRPKLKEMLL